MTTKQKPLYNAAAHKIVNQICLQLVGPIDFFVKPIEKNYRARVLM